MNRSILRDVMHLTASRHARGSSMSDPQEAPAGDCSERARTMAMMVP